MEIKKRYQLVSIGLIIMVILNIVMIGSLWVMRPPFRKHHDMRSRPYIQRVLDRKLNLSDDQQQQFNNLRKTYRRQIRTALSRVRQNREKLYEITGTEDSVKTDSLTTLIAEGHKKIETINVQHFRSLRTILNPDQQHKFDKMLSRVINFSTRRPE